ncbi:hypothetical protein AB1286_16550 [Trinickia sp. NRRL B-1857]|uniref:hypothetical protein n=1 Tax=Trinickia sp. NRRL B-1857 TaxID=3162879 RepID=UPI003D2D6982
MSNADLRFDGETRRSAKCSRDCVGQNRGAGGGNGYKSELARIGAFFASSWLAAGALYLGRHSVGLIAVSAVLVFAGFDLFRPE